LQTSDKSHDVNSRGENLSVHFHARLLQTKNELVVIQSILARRGADANDPKAAEVALSHFPVAICVAQGLFDRLFGKFIQFALIEVIALRKAEKLLSAIMPFCSAFNSRHCGSPFLASAFLYGCALGLALRAAGHSWYAVSRNP
jgi:hypothetical protein